MHIRYLNKRDLIDYSLLFLFVSISGNPLFNNDLLILGVFFYSSVVFYFRNLKIDFYFLIFILILFLVSLIQTIEFSFFSPVTTIGLFIKIITAYFVVKSLNTEFAQKYIRLMYLLSIISLFFYLVSNLPGNPLYPFSIQINTRYSVLGLFTFIQNLEWRNSGPFWEPGAFAGYLLIAFILNFLKTKNLKDKTNTIFIITLLTTFSTTGYLALFVFLFFSYYKLFKNPIFKLFSVATIFGIAAYAYMTFDFLGNKIESQLKMAQKLESSRGLQSTTNSQRFLSISRDLQDIKGHELFGRGGNNFTRYDTKIKSLQMRTVGLTDAMVRYGIPFYLLMLFFLFKSICAYSNYINNDPYNCTGSFITILVTLLSEVYFGFPLYWALLFLQFIYVRKNSV